MESQAAAVALCGLLIALWGVIAAIISGAGPINYNDHEPDGESDWEDEA